MNKRETVWLLVRLIGVYFTYLAIVTVFSLVSSVSLMVTLATPAVPPKPEIENVRGVNAPGFPKPDSEPQASQRPDPAADKLKSEAFKSILLYLFLTALYGAVGIYLIKKGTLLYEILINENIASRQERDPAVTTLDL
jgi:hypothetical protein